VCPRAGGSRVWGAGWIPGADIETDVQRVLAEGSGIPDELLDTLVVAADDPLITEARNAWEREHAPRRP
jgi:hypothetical protein